MREIGTELKQERINQELSLEDISEKTRFSIAQLTALEEGDLDFFKDDITYVKFFVQNYCKVLKIDFNRFKSDFDDSMLTYANALTQKEIEEINKVNEEIKKKVNLHQSLNSTKPKRKRKKVDFSVLSLLVISTLMVVGLFVIVSQYVVPAWLDSNPKPGTTKPWVEEPGITTTTTTTSSPVKTMGIVATSDSDYILSGFEEGDIIQLQIKFHYRTWIEVKQDGSSFQNPKSKIYLPDESIVYEIVAKEGSVLSLNLGYFHSNEFFINDQPWVLQDAVANRKGGHIVRITLKGA